MEDVYIIWIIKYTCIWIYTWHIETLKSCNSGKYLACFINEMAFEVRLENRQYSYKPEWKWEIFQKEID